MTAGDHVQLARPLVWCGRTLQPGSEWVVHTVSDFPAAAGGPVYILNHPGGTPTDYGPIVGLADLTENPMAKLKLYRAVVNYLPPDLRDELRLRRHISQYELTGTAPTWSDFVRRAVAIGLESREENARDPYARASRQLKWSGGESWNEEDRRFADAAYPLLVAGTVTGRQGAPRVVLPMDVASPHLVGDRNVRPQHYTLLSLLTEPGNSLTRVIRPRLDRGGRPLPPADLGGVYAEGVAEDTTWVAVHPNMHATSSDWPTRDAALRALLTLHTTGLLPRSPEENR